MMLFIFQVFRKKTKKRKIIHILNELDKHGSKAVSLALVSIYMFKRNDAAANRRDLKEITLPRNHHRRKNWNQYDKIDGLPLLRRCEHNPTHEKIKNIHVNITIRMPLRKKKTNLNYNMAS